MLLVKKEALKFVAVVLALVISLVAIGSPCPLAQAANNTDEVNLTANVVSPPSITTNEPIFVFTRFAILYGSLDSLGTAKTVKVYFEWGETTDYGFTTRVRTIRRPRPFVAIIRGLTPGTTYHFRAVAKGDGVTAYGDVLSFTTKKRFWWMSK